MMCDECGIRPANIHLTTIVGNERQEKNLCPECIAKYQKTFPKIDFGNIAGVLGGLLDPGKLKDRNDEEDIDLACKHCGMTYKEFKKGDQLGCIHCYETFAPQIEKALGRIHGNTQHAGKVPGGVSSEVAVNMAIEKARQELSRAIAEEEYEKAAELRDRIKDLNAKLNGMRQSSEASGNE